jgi:predicted ATPase
MKLTDIRIEKGEFGQGYPFTVAAIQSLDRLSLTHPVAIFVGENGTGKSTLLEAIAAAAQLPVLGGAQAIGPVRKLADCLRLSWKQKTRRGFCLRAEDFIYFSRRLDATRSGLEEDLEQLAGEFSGRSQYAHNLARMPLVGQLQELQEIYGGSLEEMSHGESFLHLFQRRLVPGGVYLLDEPETPLSPVKQLALIALITDMVREDCQFIISTHSPILMAVPGAEILSFDQLPPGPVQYEDLEHVRITRDFLNEPDRFLRHFR